MEQKFDFSLHFTLKGQSIKEIEKKVMDWFENNTLSDDILIPGDEDANTDVRLHHCFIPRKVVERKAMDPAVCDFLDKVCKKQISWYSAGAKLDESRKLMIQNLQRLDGVAIFVEPLIEGVEIEFDLVKEIGVDWIVIN